jgi:hypothetical protein
MPVNVHKPKFGETGREMCGKYVAMQGSIVTDLPKYFNDIAMAFLGGDLDGCSSLSRAGVQVGTGFEQQLEHLYMAPSGGPHQHREAIRTPGVRVGTRYK